MPTKDTQARTAMVKTLSMDKKKKHTGKLNNNYLGTVYGLNEYSLPCICLLSVS